MRRPRGVGVTIAATWAVLGVAAIFLSAVVRLGGSGVAAIREGLGVFEWIGLVGLTALFAYGKGLHVLQRRWVPRLMSRSRRLTSDDKLVYRLLAPLYGMSLIGPTGRDLVRGWMTTGAIVLAILWVRTLPDPWRGITAFAVAGALAWGLVAIVLAVRQEIDGLLGRERGARLSP